MCSFGFDSHRPLEKLFWGRAQNGRTSTFRSSLTQQQKAGALYRARTVHLWTTLRPPGLALNEKQIPRFVGNNGNASRKWNAWNELSCAQGRRATRLRYAPTVTALFILKHFPTLLLIRIAIFFLTVPELCQILSLDRRCARIQRHLVGLTVHFLQGLSLHL